MASTDPRKPVVLDEDAKYDFLAKKAKKKFKNQQRKYRREAETDLGELNIIPMLDMMTILLVFLLKSYGAADITVTMNEDLMPPTSTATLQPVQTITVTVTKKNIAVGEKGVVNLEPGPDGLPTVPAAARDPQQALLITPVKEALDAEVEKLERLMEINQAMGATADTEKDPRRMLTVVGDKDMSYELLFSVLGTAGQAGLKYFKFLVISKNG